MKKWFVLVLMVVAFAAFGDARFVEAPAECHFPYDAANNDNEYRSQSCGGVLQNVAGGNAVNAFVEVKRTAVPRYMYIIDGQDVTDQDTYPNGEYVVTVTGDDSGANCNVIDADGTAYATAVWTSTIQVRRTQSISRVDVIYRLSCSRATVQ